MSASAAVVNQRALEKALEKCGVSKMAEAEALALCSVGAASRGATDEIGKTPLHVAARHSASTAVIQELIAANTSSLWSMMHPGDPFTVNVPDGFTEGQRLVVNTSMSGKMTCDS